MPPPNKPMDSGERKIVFQLHATGNTEREIVNKVSERNRKTVGRLVKTLVALDQHKLGGALTDEQWGKVCGQLEPTGATRHYVEEVARHYEAWKQVKSETQRHEQATELSINVGQQFHVWEGAGKTSFVRAVSVEPVPDSTGSTINFGPLGPAQSIVRPAAEVLGLEANELARLRILLLSDVQVTLEEIRPSRSPKQKGIKRMVDAFTINRDPTLNSTLFWLYGSNNDLFIRVFNPTQYEERLLRISFYGWRIRTEPVEGPAVNENVVEAITRGWN